MITFSGVQMIAEVFSLLQILTCSVPSGDHHDSFTSASFRILESLLSELGDTLCQWGTCQLVEVCETGLK